MFGADLEGFGKTRSSRGIALLAVTMDGLFYMLGQEEMKIRTSPAAQITPLLKEVFGKR